MSLKQNPEHVAPEVGGGLDDYEGSASRNPMKEFAGLKKSEDYWKMEERGLLYSGDKFTKTRS